MHQPIVDELRRRGTPFHGVLYAGLMLTSDGPQVLEFNARFGDPETQPLLFRMKSDLVEFLLACARPDGSLAKMKIEWDNPAVCVVMASQGYPGSYKKGKPIQGLDKVEKMEGVFVFHAGTRVENGQCLTAGGRVLGVTGLGKGIKQGMEITYRAVSEITWEGVHFRTDIGKKALAWLEE